MNLPLLDVFVSQYESAETKRAYSRDIIRFFSHVKKEPDKITKADAISYVQMLKSEKLVARSIARSVYAVRSYMKFLLNMEVLGRNPMDGIRLPRSFSAPETGITDQEISRMISSFNSRKNDRKKKLDQAVFNLMLYNGLRRSEVCAINYGDIRMEQDVFVLEIRGKGSKTRVRPMHPACRRAITEYLKHDDRLSGQSGDPVFINNDGSRLDPYSVYTSIRRISRKARLGRMIHPHMLRAKFASMALESGQPITSVQADMGHSNIETTAIYDRAKHSLERSAILGIKEIRITKQQPKTAGRSRRCSTRKH